jgi:hypothetical protein
MAERENPYWRVKADMSIYKRDGPAYMEVGRDR